MEDKEFALMVKNLADKLEDLSETRWYYKGDEPWQAIKEIAGIAALIMQKLLNQDKEFDEF